MKLIIEDHTGKVIGVGTLIVTERIRNNANAKLEFRALEPGWIQYVTTLGENNRHWRMHALSIKGMRETYLRPGEQHVYQVVLTEPAPYMRPAGWRARLLGVFGRKSNARGTDRECPES